MPKRLLNMIFHNSPINSLTKAMLLFLRVATISGLTRSRFFSLKSCNDQNKVITNTVRRFSFLLCCEAYMI